MDSEEGAVAQMRIWRIRDFVCAFGSTEINVGLK